MGAAAFKELGIVPSVMVSPSFNRAKPQSTNIRTKNTTTKELIMGTHKKSKCTREGCESPVQKDGLCYKHYKETYGKAPYASQATKGRGGKLPTERKCSFPGCEKYRVKEGLCIAHYKDSNPKLSKPAKLESRLDPADDKGIQEGAFLCAESEKLIFADYVIKVDFFRYPKLHERLLKMSEEDIRNPGDQLLFLIRNTLTEMELQA
jgi:hypothetical protein